MNIFHHLLQCLSYSLSSKSASTYDMVLLWKLLIWNLSIGNFSSSTIKQHSRVISPVILQISTKYLTCTCISQSCNKHSEDLRWLETLKMSWVGFTDQSLSSSSGTNKGESWRGVVLLLGDIHLFKHKVIQFLLIRKRLLNSKSVNTFQKSGIIFSFLTDFALSLNSLFKHVPICCNLVLLFIHAFAYCFIQIGTQLFVTSPVWIFGRYSCETSAGPPPPLLSERGLPRVVYLGGLGQRKLWGGPHQGYVESGHRGEKGVDQRVPIHFRWNWNTKGNL